MALSMDQLALSQPQTSLLYVDEYWIWQVAPHYKQGTENHLKHGIHKEELSLRCTAQDKQH